MSCAKCQHERIVSQSRSSCSQPSYFRFFSEKLSYFSRNIRDVSWADVTGENDLELINWFSHSHFLGHPKTQTMQTAVCWLCRPCGLRTFLLTLGSLFRFHSVQYVLMFQCYLSTGRTPQTQHPTVDSINILKANIKIKFHTFWAQPAVCMVSVLVWPHFFSLPFDRHWSPSGKIFLKSSNEDDRYDAVL